MYIAKPPIHICEHVVFIINEIENSAQGFSFHSREKSQVYIINESELLHTSKYVHVFKL